MQSTRDIRYTGEAIDGRQIRVCMVSGLYPPLFAGGAYQAHSLAIELMKLGVSVFVCTGGFKGLQARETIDGVDVRRLRAIKHVPLISDAYDTLELLVALFRWRHEYDILHSHSTSSLFNVLTIAFARRLGKRTLIKMSLVGSSGDPAAWAHSRFGWLRRYAFEAADGVISISNELTGHYLEAGLEPAKLARMPQGVRLDRFGPRARGEKREDLCAKLGLPADQRYLIFVGSLRYRKGADILIDAFRIVSDRYEDVDLLFVGMDSFEDHPLGYVKDWVEFAASAKQQVAELRLQQRVIFTGLVENVPDYLRVADLFVFPSRREGFPNAVIEAAAVGLPCVVANLTGTAAEIFKDGIDGIIVDGETPSAYADAIFQLLADPAEADRMGKRARRRAIERYAMDQVADAYRRLYARLLNQSFDNQGFQEAFQGATET